MMLGIISLIISVLSLGISIASPEFAKLSLLNRFLAVAASGLSVALAILIFIREDAESYVAANPQLAVYGTIVLIGIVVIVAVLSIVKTKNV
ncbi:MAG: hypothetical protein WBV93_08755 [Anaerobacillus sp.]